MKKSDYLYGIKVSGAIDTKRLVEYLYSKGYLWAGDRSEDKDESIEYREFTLEECIKHNESCIGIEHNDRLCYNVPGHRVDHYFEFDNEFIEKFDFHLESNKMGLL